MKRYEALETLFCKVDLTFAPKILNEPYHPLGSRGRPPRNQCKGVKGILRVDRKFRSHGPALFRRAYKKRVAVERVFSRLKNLAGLAQHNLRGLSKLTFHSQLCVIIMLLTAQAAINTRNQCKARSIRYFAN